MLWYATDSNPNDWVPLKLDQVNEILEANENGEFPEDLGDFRFEEVKVEKVTGLEVADFVGGNAEDSITRFDSPKKRRNRGNNRNRNRNRNRNKKQGDKAPKK